MKLEYRIEPTVRVKTLPDDEPDMIGIYAGAILTRRYVTTGGYQNIGDVQTGGLWGIEHDVDPEYYAVVANEQLDDLLDILTDLGIDPETARNAVDAARP